MRPQPFHPGTPAFGRSASTALLLSALLAVAPVSLAGEFVPHHASSSGQVRSSSEIPGGYRNVAIGSGVGTYEGAFTEVNLFDVTLQSTELGIVTVIEGTLTVIAANGGLADDLVLGR